MTFDSVVDPKPDDRAFRANLERVRQESARRQREHNLWLVVVVIVGLFWLALLAALVLRG